MSEISREARGGHGSGTNLRVVLGKCRISIEIWGNQGADNSIREYLKMERGEIRTLEEILKAAVV